MAFHLSIVVDSLALLALVLLLVAFDQRRKRQTFRYPPGPKPLPILGNLFDVPKESSWLKYTEWSKTYGEIMSLQVLGNVVVILNSARVARDLLEKKGEIHSGRPTVPFYDMMNWSWLITTMQYSDTWRHRRRMLDRSLRPNAAIQYRPMLRSKAHDFLKHMISRPEDFRRHIEHLQGAIIMSLVYGYDVKGKDDVYLKTALDANDIAQRTFLPGAVLVNDLPFLKHLPEWLPGMGFKALARLGDRLGKEMVNKPFAFVKDTMHNGTARPSVTRENLLEMEQRGLVEAEDEQVVAEASGTLYVTGADTTSSALASLFLALVLHPEAQKRAQAEIAAVVGKDRLPDFGDRANLPYTDALSREVLRWRVVNPLGVPHASTQDDFYEGYFIPKGTIVVPNAWAIMHDPTVYPDPDAFKPERFLTEDGQVKDDPASSIAFGFGKRICPGRHIADSTVFIVAALVLSTFSVGKAKDLHGNEIPVECAYTGGIISDPKEFKCAIVPRTPKAEQLISANEPVE
ncbi:cytochrome P450 [Artomyces pyxidatus]|uniref:Cytochrome P450 n=1 Tax=Artomyces pyxidatus TaxID=48021 RepID=A0ACB8TDY2_9AGAM|nr:cytochrome P450 [Artomyces pyxidatus]